MTPRETRPEDSTDSKTTFRGLYLKTSVVTYKKSEKKIVCIRLTHIFWKVASKAVLLKIFISTTMQYFEYDNVS